MKAETLSRQYNMSIAIIIMLIASTSELIYYGVSQDSLNWAAFICFLCSSYLFINNLINYKELKYRIR